MSESPGVAIKASLVQKVIKERKESLMARARASLGIASLEPCAVSEPLSAHPDVSSIGLKRAAPDEHGVPSALGSKNARKSKSKVPCHRMKTRSMNSPGGEANEKNREDKQAELELELEDEHQQLEIENGKGETSPNSSISSRGSVMKTRFGEDSLRLYKACLLPMDQIELASMTHCTLEEILAHDLMRVVAVTHQLALKCAKWQKETEEKAAQVKRVKENVEAEVRAEHEQRLHTLECQLTELKAWSEKAEKMLLKSKLEIERLEKEGMNSFDAGRAAGRHEMSVSEEFRAAIRQARVSGAEDYLRSPTFELVLAAKAAEHEVIGFMRCQSQVLKLGGFKEGFDVGLLDSAKDGNLESPVAKVEEMQLIED